MNAIEQYFEQFRGDEADVSANENALTWRDLSIEQRVALEEVARYACYSRRYTLAGTALARAGLIWHNPNAAIPTMGWRLTLKGQQVLKGKQHGTIR